jgi:hypothetical protein
LHRAIASKYQQKPEFVGAFIEYFKDNSSLRDVDRLAFVDLVDELLSVDIEEERTHGLSKSSTQSALQKINDELKAIQSVYQKEVSRVFSSLGTRGKHRYVRSGKTTSLSSKVCFSRDQVLTPYDRGKPEQDDGLRGARHDSKTEIYGYDLPPKSIVLTFDDGPHPRYTDEVLAILKKYNARAFFFDVGKCLGSVTPQNEIKLSTNSNVSKRVLEAGHLLANHSYSHPDLTKLSPTIEAKRL